VADVSDGVWLSSGVSGEWRDLLALRPEHPAAIIAHLSQHDVEATIRQQPDQFLEVISWMPLEADPADPP
jgi:hypothetical protein